MTRTKTQMRLATARELQIFPYQTGTSTTGGDTNTVKVTEFGFFPDNTLRGLHLYVAGVSPFHYRVTQNDQSNISADYLPVTSSGALDSEAYELLPFSHTDIHAALESAIDEAWDEGWLGRPFTLHHYGSRSPIYNGSFEYWTAATAADGWTASGSLVATKVQLATGSALGVVGESYASFGTATGNFRLNTNFMRYLTDFAGTSVTLRMLCRTDTASALRMRLLGDASATLGTSGYHDGDDTWHVLTLDVDISETNTEIRPEILIDSVAGTALVKAIWIEGGPFFTHDIPFPIGLAPNGPDSVEFVRMAVDETNEQMVQVDSRPNYIQNWGFEYTQPEALSGGDVFAVISPGIPLPSLSRLVMHCTGPLTKPSTDSGVTEIRTDIDLNLLAKMAARILLQRRKNKAPSSLQALISSRLIDLNGEITRLSNGKGASDKDSAPLGIPIRFGGRSRRSGIWRP